MLTGLSDCSSSLSQISLPTVFRTSLHKYTKQGIVTIWDKRLLSHKSINIDPSTLTTLHWGWGQHIVANAHWPHTLALVAGQQKLAVKNHHLVPEVISAVKHPARRTLYLNSGSNLFNWSVQMSSHSPPGIRTVCIRAEQVIGCSPAGSAATFPGYSQTWKRLHSTCYGGDLCNLSWVFELTQSNFYASRHSPPDTPANANNVPAPHSVANRRVTLVHVAYLTQMN